MKFGELITQSRSAFVVLALGIALTACGNNGKTPQQTSPPVGETTAHEAGPGKTQEQTTTPAVASRSEMMKREIGAMYVEIKRYEAELAAKEQALQHLQQELHATKADLAAKDDQVRLLTGQLGEREASLKTYKSIAFAGLGIGAIMFLIGYLSLRAGRKRKAKLATSEAEGSAAA